MESMEARKLAIITGLYANTNYDDGKQTRTRAIHDMEDNFREAIISLYDPETKEEDLDKDPFFEAIDIPGGDIDWEEYAKNNPSIKDPPMAELVPDDDIDQGTP